MKKFYTLLLMLCSFGIGYGQDWIPLGADPSGDDEGLGPDIASLCVAIDVAQDSIWFRIMTHDPMTEFGFNIYIDDDQNPADGCSPEEVWGGPGSGYSAPNTSIGMDNRFIFISRGSSAEQSWTETWCPGGASSSAAPFYTPDANTMIVNALLSDVDLDGGGDGKFNVVVAACEPWLGAGSDYIPDAGSYFTVNPPTAGTEIVTVEPKLTVYPNPTTDKLIVRHQDLDHRSTIKLLNVIGEELPFELKVQNGEAELDLAHLKPQVLFLQLSTTYGESETLKIIKR
jgi:hypothetical protein